MTKSQVSAAKILLDKVVPNAPIEIGAGGGVLNINILLGDEPRSVGSSSLAPLEPEAHRAVRSAGFPILADELQPVDRPSRPASLFPNVSPELKKGQS